MLRERKVDAGGIELNLAEGPANGPPLLLLHGGSARWQSWESLAPALLPRFQVSALDLRGHGRSGWRAPYTLASYAADLVRLLEAHFHQPAIVCGHSLGGMVALLAAARRPRNLRGLIIADAPLSAEDWLRVLAESRPRLAEWHALAASRAPAKQIAGALRESPVELPGQSGPVPAREMFGEDAPWFAWMAQNLALLDPTTLSILLDDPAGAAEGYAVERIFPALACPTWLLQADPAAGGLMASEEIERAVRLGAQVRHRQLPGLGHAMHATHPEPVLQALLECAELI